MGVTTVQPDMQLCPDFMFISNESAAMEFEELAMDSTGGCPGIFFSDTSGGLRELSFFRSISENMFANTSVSVDFQHLLETIGSVLGLNKSQLAEVCGLRTRKSLYAWESGTIPRKKSMQRIYLLYRAALDWRRSGFIYPGNALHLPILQGKTLYDLLREDPLDLEAIHFAGARLSMESDSGTGLIMTEPFAE
ncbi:MAG: hypothetical protein ACQEUB_13975 [Thermodesulfobacteriota bacterium]